MNDINLTFERFGDQVLRLGRVGENRATRILINLKSILSQYPNATASITAKQPGREEYPAVVKQEGSILTWEITKDDIGNKAGNGQAQITIQDADGTIIKTAIACTLISESLGNTTTPAPDPVEMWIDKATSTLADVERSGNAAQAVADEVQRRLDNGDFVGPQGPQGDTGETGPIGPQGPKGEKGDKGEQGNTGPQGETGAKGDAFTFDDFTPEQLESLRGPKGDTGATGAQGTKGDKGDKGDTGAKGEPGKDAVIDAMLTQEGEAADAKATGEAINQITGDAIALSGKLEKTEKRAERAEATARYAIKMQQGYTYDCKTVVGSGSEVDVPVGAKDYAGLRKIGGMSRKGYQMLLDDFPKGSSQLSVTKNGNYNYKLTTLSSGIYRQSNGSLNVNGLAGMYTLRAEIVGTGGLIIRFYTQDNTKIIETTITSDDPKNTINVLENFVRIGLVFLGNTSREVPIGSVTTISSIMLEPGNTAHQFEPYTADLIVASIDSVVSKRAGGEVIHTTDLPTGMLPLCPDCGQGTADSYNYIDFEAKSYHHVGSMTRDGVWTALEAPEIIDLSAAWPDDLELLTVESGGTVQMHYPKLDEGFALAVPSEIVFAVDIAKAVKE